MSPHHLLQHLNATILLPRTPGQVLDHSLLILLHVPNSHSGGLARGYDQVWTLILIQWNFRLNVDFGPKDDNGNMLQ